VTIFQVITWVGMLSETVRAGLDKFEVVFVACHRAQNGALSIMDARWPARLVFNMISRNVDRNGAQYIPRSHLWV
jgi:hypothetical protein